MDFKPLPIVDRRIGEVGLSLADHATGEGWYILWAEENERINFA